MARTQSSVACVTKAEGELVALHQAMLVAIEKGYNHVQFETDCQIIVKAIYQQKQLMSLKWVLLFVRLGP